MYLNIGLVVFNAKCVPISLCYLSGYFQRPNSSFIIQDFSNSVTTIVRLLFFFFWVDFPFNPVNWTLNSLTEQQRTK